MILTMLSIFDNISNIKLSLINPLSHQLYSLINLHQPGYQICPVVSYLKPLQLLINIIKEICNFTAKFTDTNSYKLINKLSPINLPTNAKFISVDVPSLFPIISP